jgi:hypothetical protein
MDISVSPSRSGAPTCFARGVWLHSRYEPEREARRFAESRIGASKPTHVILLGPCLDYLTPALRAILPGARLVRLQYSPLFEADAVGRPDAGWNPNADVGIETFLDAALDEDAISGVAVLEWEPAARAFPEEARLAREAVSASLDRLASSTATVKASGKRWIANACASFLLADHALEPKATNAPVLVAAAGPSLRGSLLGIAGLKQRFITLAVSSSLAACRAVGLDPDLVVSTDGGYWSRLHVYPMAGQQGRAAWSLAAPLSALPSASIYGRTGILVLDQGSFAESELLPGLARGRRVGLSLPPHGTVSGTAIQLAARLTTGPIIVAGLDLASYGERDHANPHGFDALFNSSASRLSPCEGVLCSRAIENYPLELEAPWRSSRSLASYASALIIDGRTINARSGPVQRLFRLGPSPVELPPFAPLDAAGFKNMLASFPFDSGSFLEPSPLQTISKRESFLSERLESWLRLAEEASEGLARGLLPESSLVSELLRSMDIVDYAAARRALLSGGNPEPAARELARRSEAFLSALHRRLFP